MGLPASDQSQLFGQAYQRLLSSAFFVPSLYQNLHDGFCGPMRFLHSFTSKLTSLVGPMGIDAAI
jgi:hypothetical protein